MPLPIALETLTTPPPAVADRIRQGLYQYNRAQVGSRQFDALTVIARDAQGEVIGGVLGGTIWQWLLIETVWVDEAARQQGLGGQLLLAAEAEALRRGCQHATLETFSFQALPFYQKHGYVVYGQLDGFPAGHTRYSLKKDLTPSLAAPERAQAATALYHLAPATTDPEREYLELLYQTALDLLNRRHLDELLQEVVEQAARILDAPYGEIMLTEGETLVVRAFTRNQPYLLGDRVQRGEALVSWRAYDTGEPVLINDYFAWSGRRVLYEGAQLQAVADFPIMKGAQCLGVLAMARVQEGQAFTPLDMQRGLMFSRLVALIVDNANLYAQAVAASRYKSELLAKVSHELRTPLAAILGFAELLCDDAYGPLAPRQKHFVTRIFESTLYLSRLIADLLDQAQIEQGQLQVQNAPLSVAALVELLTDTLRPLAERKDLQLVVEVAPEVPPTLLGDVTRLQQIFINLANNAIKFTTTGSVTLRLTCPTTTEWQIDVIDTGPGIAPTVQAKVFEAFWQADHTLTGKQKGYGLGLSIVKHLVTVMGGEVRLTSTVGQGTTFTVTLPLRLPESTAAQRPEPLEGEDGLASVAH